MHIHFCSTECNEGKFGLNCNLPCGHCLDNVDCHYIDGTCLNGCDSGYQGSNVNKVYVTICSKTFVGILYRFRIAFVYQFN